jgi:hypothetical protein
VRRMGTRLGDGQRSARGYRRPFGQTSDGGVLDGFSAALGGRAWTTSKALGRRCGSGSKEHRLGAGSGAARQARSTASGEPWGSFSTVRPMTLRGPCGRLTRSVLDLVTKATRVGSISRDRSRREVAKVQSGRSGRGSSAMAAPAERRPSESSGQGFQRADWVRGGVGTLNVGDDGGVDVFAHETHQGAGGGRFLAVRGAGARGQGRDVRTRCRRAQRFCRAAVRTSASSLRRASRTAGLATASPRRFEGAEQGDLAQCRRFGIRSARAFVASLPPCRALRSTATICISVCRREDFGQAGDGLRGIERNRRSAAVRASSTFPSDRSTCVEIGRRRSAGWRRQCVGTRSRASATTGGPAQATVWRVAARARMASGPPMRRGPRAAVATSYWRREGFDEGGRGGRFAAVGDGIQEGHAQADRSARREPREGRFQPRRWGSSGACGGGFAALGVGIGQQGRTAGTDSGPAE